MRFVTRHKIGGGNSEIILKVVGGVLFSNVGLMHVFE